MIFPACAPLLSTGSPLVPESFDYIYAHIKADLQVASISGGTDIVSCFVLGDFRRALSDAARSRAPASAWTSKCGTTKGSASSTSKASSSAATPFPSMPIYFYGDEGGARYRKRLFRALPRCLVPRRFYARDPRGRLRDHRAMSDAVLNPGGVRIGTAEIYRQVERLAEIQEAVVIGQPWEADVRVVLSRRSHGGARASTMSSARGSSARFAPTPARVMSRRRFLEVEGIPRTRSGKISELSVRRVVCGQDVKNKEALANTPRRSTSSAIASNSQPDVAPRSDASLTTLVAGTGACSACTQRQHIVPERWPTVWIQFGCPGSSCATITRRDPSGSSCATCLFVWIRK